MGDLRQRRRSENAPYLTTLTPLTNYTKRGSRTRLTVRHALRHADRYEPGLNTGVFLGATVDANARRNARDLVKLSVGAFTPSSGNNDYAVMGQSLWRPSSGAAGTPGTDGAHRRLPRSARWQPHGVAMFNWDNAALVGSLILVEPWVGSF
jgi:hypothetical protein